MNEGPHEGSVGGHILQLSLFIAMSTTFQTLYFLADLYSSASFQMRHVWYVSLASVGVQTCVNLWLLRREFGRRLDFPEVRAAAPLAAAPS